MGGVQMIYRDEMTKAMTMLCEIPNTIFLGQSIKYSGNVMFSTLKDVPMEKRIELPVFEDTQMGMSAGLSLAGYLPISIFPRIDFLLCALNQLVNHLDKIEQMSEGRFKPKVIIRTLIGTKSPMDSGPQHTGDYHEAISMMLKHVKVIYLDNPDIVYQCYKQAAKADYSTILVERGDLYDVQPGEQYKK
jgi:pyruvate/2-oxoglutarate/acetoin dehydrogenase E1 component